MIDLDLTASGTDSDRIVFDAYGTGDLPVINEIGVDGSFTTLQNLIVDHGNRVVMQFKSRVRMA